MDNTTPDININQRMAIPGDQVQTALKRLIEQGEIDEAGKSEIFWLYSYAMDNNWNLDDVGKAIDKDSTTVYRMFLGRYGARYDGLIKAVAAYHKIAKSRAQRKKDIFVETTTWAKIDQVCRHAFIGQLPAFIYGSSQIGKSFCLEEYARRNNHGQTRYVRLPAACGLVQAQREIGNAVYIKGRCSSGDLRDRIIDSINDNMLLIIDEMHQALPPLTRKGVGIRVIEWLREIYDRKRCGIIFCGTKMFRDEIENGKDCLVLEQFRRRSIISLTLPDVAPKADVIKIARAYSLPPPEGAAEEIVSRMIKNSGLGQYVEFLKSATNLAANQNKQLSWDHFVQSFDIIQSLSTTTKKVS